MASSALKRGQLGQMPGAHDYKQRSIGFMIKGKGAGSKFVQEPIILTGGPGQGPP